MLNTQNSPCKSKKASYFACGIAVGIVSLLTLFVFHDGQAAPSIIQAQVVSVADGDTVTVMISGKNMRVRFAGIDAPEVKHNNNESNQPWGQAAKAELDHLINGKIIDLDCDGQSYDRQVCTIFYNGLNVNEWLVQNGHAWAYNRFDKSGRYGQLERKAEANRLGLWGLSHDQIIEPKDWRKALRHQN